MGLPPWEEEMEAGALHGWGRRSGEVQTRRPLPCSIRVCAALLDRATGLDPHRRRGPLSALPAADCVVAASQERRHLLG